MPPAAYISSHSSSTSSISEPLPPYTEDEALEPGPRYTKHDFVRGQKIMVLEVLGEKRKAKGMMPVVKVILFAVMVVFLLVGVGYLGVVLEGVVRGNAKGQKGGGNI
ncbi:hypothetical protein BJY04DRAFT_224365 [Aspergillus karnatakaensis]|uniref:uncharacterized protein n=1 Tax=Aspergillus karnatakaensis TaxID=1810916 RepID=UPI003CCD7ACF